MGSGGIPPVCLAVDDGLARRLKVVGQDIVELLLEEFLHILDADADIGRFLAVEGLIAA